MTSGSLLLAASIMGRRLDFYDAADGVVVATIGGLVSEPHELAVSPEHRRAYLSHTYRSGAYAGAAPKAHEISVIDVDRRLVEAVVDIDPFRAPHGIVYCAATDSVYAGVERTADSPLGVVILDPVSATVRGAIPTAAPNSHWLSVTSAGDRAFVSHKDAGLVSVLDLTTRECVAAITVPGGTEEIGCAPNGDDVFVVTPTLGVQTGRASVLRIDARTFEPRDEVEVGAFAVALAVAPDGRVLVSRRLGTPTGDAGSELVVVDPGAMAVIARIPLEGRGFSIRVDAASTRAYVANLGSGTISVIDLDSCTAIASWPHVVGTHGLALMDG